MAQQAFPITNYQLPDGSPVANGYLLIRLNIDGNVSDSSIDSNFIRVPLDSDGNISGSPVFWPNDEISPSGTYYVLKVYQANGKLVAGPMVVTITEVLF